MSVSVDPGTRYRIRVAGRLGSEWSARLTGMTLVVQQPPGEPVTTVLSGVFSDQAALMGLLQQLYNVGAQLVTVERIGDERSSNSGQERRV